MNESYFNKKLEPIKVKEKSVSQLLAEMSRTAYQGRKLGEAVEVWEKMLKDPDLIIVMGLAGSMSTAGQWTIVNWLMENRLGLKTSHSAFTSAAHVTNFSFFICVSFTSSEQGCPLP